MATENQLPYINKALQRPGIGSHAILPPTPPDTDTNSSSSECGEEWVNHAHNVLFPPLPPSNVSALKVLPEDKKTPDNHVARDPRLIRLTGIHPFNVEPPLSDLWADGFFTSAELFYVRNHGAVPEVHDSEIPDWEFSVEGHVKKPFKLTLRELIEQYEQITVPITLVCAGNRRKEQNQVRKSKGFSWGAAGVSNALWTGVPLGEIIKRAMPKKGAKYVCMEGADKLPNGHYGTSVKLNWALDPNRGMMLAHGMNGEMLTPDHGKPLRVVIPGQIGGRSVKWLKKLIVTEAPSDNWYHIYDNRVLPTMISPEESVNNESWWKDERYAIYDLSTNSATAYPAHDEKLLITEGAASEFYKAKGYAYGGGGRRITRVEITLDKGKSWLLASINYHEDLYRDHPDENQKIFGGRLDMSWRETCFCWCFWELDIPVDKLADSNDIMVRAMDESMNIQPRDMYWSVLGMMNNPWFRVTITRVGDHLHFEHPNQAALIPGGWMEKVKERGGDLTNGFWGESMNGEVETAAKEEKVEINMTKDDIKREISIEELREHEGEAEPWFVVHGEVYDGTAFLAGHPGGATSITGAAAQDASDEFMAIHSETAKAMMPEYHIGTLSAEALKALLEPQAETEAESSSPREVFLQPRKWTKAILSSKTPVSSDTRIFTFNLDHPRQKIGLPTGQHLMLSLRDPVTRENIIRSYTPLSISDQLGTLDILIKVYFPDKESKNPGGKMTMALESIPIGHSVEFKGPIGKFVYLGNGKCDMSGKIRHVKRFFMICGGSGITPIYQVLRAVLSNGDDETKCVMLNGNRTEGDILCRDELDMLARLEEENGKGRFRMVHVLSKAGEGWQGLKGYVGMELFDKEIGRKEEKANRQGPGEDLILFCGPDAMEKSVKKELDLLGWKDEDILYF